MSGIIPGIVASSNQAGASAYGPELVINGSFDTSDGWTIGANWSVSGGKGIANGVTGGSTYLSQWGAFENGKTYLITYDAIVTQGRVFCYVAGTDFLGTAHNISGSYSETVIATAAGGIYMSGYDDFIGSVDNISVREIL